MKCCLITGLSLLCTHIYAQQADSAKVNHLKEVRVQGKKTGIVNSSASPAQVIGGEALQRLNSFSVADALRYFSGIQLKDYGGVGGLKTVNVRSLGSNHTTVFYDGVQMGNAQNGQVDLGRFSLDNMEEVSLYNGQKSEILQPAKAFSSASSIYMRSRQPQLAGDEMSQVRWSLKGGSFGLINPSVLYDQKITNHTALSLSTEWVKANGEYRFRYTNGVYDTTARRNNTDINAFRAELGFAGVLKDSSSWSAKVYAYSSERGLPGAIVANRFDYHQRQWDRNFFIQGHFQSNENKTYAWMVNAKYANDYLRYLDPDFVTLDGFQDNRFRQQEIYLSGASRYFISPGWGVSLSADYQWNGLDANLYRFTYPTRHTVLAALASEFKLNDFSFQASLLGTFVFDRVKVYSSAGDKQEFSPTLMATYHPFGSKKLMFRAFYKNIFRLPTFNDLYYTFIGNALLRPEFTDQYNLGFTYTLKPANVALVSFALQADAYYNEVKDKIVAVPSANLYRWTMYNIGKVAVKGVETNIQTVWRIAQNLVVNASISYTFQQARDVTDGEIYPFNIPYVPVHSGSFVCSLDWKRLEFNYSYIYSGYRYNQLSTANNAVYNYMQPWYTHDAGLGYGIKISGRPVKMNLEVNNIFNQDREMIANFPMPRRFYRFKISFTI
ncbi:TonB-dependent receptor plug domain-containing protein [Pedobacter frigidisoli]|uniref:TonB-dependent receptor plug domain-containing protein n=1 Tax=Pedobacter frigidisoli TaxID=2530455 RepID=UPI0029318F75|nr:TonB-dependent receptor [Pedobacter frigidisoli]